MADASITRLGALLNDHVLQWLQKGTAHIVYAQPPFTAPAAVQIIPSATPILRRKTSRQSNMTLAHWPQHGLVSVRFMRFAFVLQGEADMELGVTEEMLRQAPGAPRTAGHYTLQMPARSILVMPPGLPFGDGAAPHWRRPHLERARSHILWMTMATGGVLMHDCTTHGAVHESITGCFVNEARLAPLIDLLHDTIVHRPARYETLAASLLLSIMLLAEARFRSGHVVILGNNDPAGPMESSGLGAAVVPHAQIVRRACTFIDDQFTTSLTVTAVARHVYVSAPHLNRLFRQELNMSVLAYINSKRLDFVQTMLRTTDISVRDISHMLAYRHPNYLNQVFQRMTGETPLAYRRRQSEVN